MKKIAKGIYLDYNKSEQPYLGMHVEDCMRATSPSKTMKKLLRRIGQARPTVTLGQNAPKGCNVLIQPPTTKKLVSLLRDRNIKSWDMGSKTAASEASTPAATGGRGAGSACWVYFSSREYKACPLFITFAHELIHCLHMLEGAMNPTNQLEEYATVGIHGYEEAEITENRIRFELKLELRDTYFDDDPKDYVPWIK